MAKILIVDGQTCIQQFYHEELTQDGYDVITSNDGYQAMAQIETLEPDLVVLDLFLRGPNGWEVLDIIKKKERYLPVIIATAYDSYREDPRLKEAEGYIVKSPNTTELKEKISELLMGQPQEECLLSATNNIFGYRKVA